MRKLLLVLFFVTLLAPLAIASNYSSNATVVSSGGGNVSSSSYSSDVAISQIVGNASSPSFKVQFGFFYAVLNNPPEIATIPNQTWNQDTSTTINLSYYSSDIDNDDLNYSSTTPENIAVSIDQATGVATLTPASGFYGTRYIVFYVSDYAETTSSNNITLTVSQVIVFAPSGGAVPMPVKNFTIDKDLIKLLLRQGETKRERVIVNNTGNTPLSFVVDISELKEFVIVDEYAFELKAGESKVLKFDFFAAERQLPDVYTGGIKIKGNDITKTINVIIDVLPKEAMFDVSLAIFPETKKIKPGEVIKADITLINLGTLRDIDIGLDLIIKDMDNKVIDSRHETLAILGDKMEIVREFKTANDIAPGDYALYVKLTYEGIAAPASDIFTVIEIKIKKPLIKTALPIFLLLLAALAIIIAIKLLREGKRLEKAPAKVPAPVFAPAKLAPPAKAPAAEVKPEGLMTPERVEEILAIQKEKAGLEKIKDYVQKTKSKGFSDSQIRAKLAERGWPPKLIRNAFEELRKKVKEERS